jgi:hypothetical protein
VPTRDTGVDLLVSDRHNRRAVSLQVKFSKDWLVTHMGPEFQQGLRACGWWKLNRDKLRLSGADFWVFVLLGFAARSVDFVVVPPRELLRRLDAIHAVRGRSRLTFGLQQAGGAGRHAGSGRKISTASRMASTPTIPGTLPNG